MCKRIKKEKIGQDTGMIHGPHGPNGPGLVPCYCCQKWNISTGEIREHSSSLGNDSLFYLVCDNCRRSILSNQDRQFPKHSRPHDSLWTKYFKQIDSGEIETGARFTIKPKDAKEFLNTEETKIEASVITGKPIPKQKAPKRVTNGGIALKQHKQDALENLKALNKQLMGQLDQLKVERETLRRDRQEDREHIAKMSRELHDATLERNAYKGQLESATERINDLNSVLIGTQTRADMFRDKYHSALSEIDQLQEEIAECERQVREALQANYREVVCV